MHSYVCVFDLDHTHILLASVADDMSYESASQIDCTTFDPPQRSNMMLCTTSLNCIAVSVVLTILTKSYPSNVQNADSNYGCGKRATRHSVPGHCPKM